MQTACDEMSAGGPRKQADPFSSSDPAEENISLGKLV